MSVIYRAVELEAHDITPKGEPLRNHYLGRGYVLLRWHLSERSNNFRTLLSIAENFVQTSLSKGVHAMASSRLSWV